MVANPANTNALILKENAPKIPNENVTCLTRLDHNRALGQIAERAKVAVTDVKNVTIWGNHSSSQYPDVNHGTVKGKPIRDVIKDDEYLNKEFIETVQQRGAAIIKVMIIIINHHHHHTNHDDDDHDRKQSYAFQRRVGECNDGLAFQTGTVGTTNILPHNA